MELLQENYFHVVLEATKSIAQKLREGTGLTSDGADLADAALALGKHGMPLLAFNTLRTDSKEFTNSAKTKAIMYQSGSSYPSREASSERGRVRQVEIDLQELYGLGFRPYRLKWMKD